MLSVAIVAVLCIAVAGLWLALSASRRRERALRLDIATDAARAFRGGCLTFLRATGWQVAAADVPIPALFFVEKDHVRLAVYIALHWVQTDFGDIGFLRKQVQKGFTPIYITGSDPDTVRTPLAAQGVTLRVVHHADLPLLHVLSLPDLIAAQPGAAFAAADGVR